MTPGPTQSPPDQPLRHRKARDRAMILPLIGFALLLPPVAGIFDIDARIFGAPVALVYIFAVWITLILTGAALAPRLRETDDPGAIDPAMRPGSDPGQDR